MHGCTFVCMDAQVKTRVTLSIDPEILKKAKSKAGEERLHLSNLVENYLDFFVDPYVYCFHCGEQFQLESGEECPVCTFAKCPHCEKCRCDEASNDEVMYHMRKVYEDLLKRRIK
jgi:hypothetical protein